MSFHQQSETLLEVKQSPFSVLLRWWAGVVSPLLLRSGMDGQNS